MLPTLAVLASLEEDMAAKVNMEEEQPPLEPRDNQLLLLQLLSRLLKISIRL